MRSLLRGSSIVFLLGFGLALGWLLRPTAAQSRPQAPHIVYDDALSNGWGDWSWNPITHDLNNSTPVHGGSYSIAVTFTGGWGGLQFGHQPALDLSGYDTLRFWIHGGIGGGQSVTVRLDGADSQTHHTAGQYLAADRYSPQRVGQSHHCRCCRSLEQH